MAIYGSMFKGDKSGPLSQEEIVALYKKFRLITPEADAKEKEAVTERLHQAVRTLNSTPTGSMVLRQMLESDRETFKIDLRANNDKISETAMGVYVPLSDVVRVKGELFQSDHGAFVFAHECTHAMQKETSGILSYTAAEVADAETQALDWQLMSELNVSKIPSYEYEKQIKKAGYTGAFADTVFNKVMMAEYVSVEDYRAVYDANYDKWMDIAKNPKKTPKGLQPFEPTKGMDINEARIAYASQMASLETRAMYIKEFCTRPHTHEDGVFDVSVATSYNEKNAQGSRAIRDTRVPEGFVEDAIARNPFLKQEDFNIARQAHGEDAVYTASEARESESSGIGSWFRNSWFGRLIGINDEEKSAESQANATALAQSQPPQSQEKEEPALAQRGASKMASIAEQKGEQQEAQPQREANASSYLANVAGARGVSTDNGVAISRSEGRV